MPRAADGAQLPATQQAQRLDPRVIGPRRTLLAAMTATLLAAVLLVTAAGAATGTTGAPRDPAQHPFSVDSPANTSIGSGATFESASALKTAALLTGSPMVNAESWSIAVALATAADPVAKVTNISNGVVRNFRVPSGAQVTAGTDKHMTVVQPDAFTAFECYKMTQISATEWTSTYIVQTDLRSNGLAAGARASGISQVMGLIRTKEVSSLSIPHTLALGIPNSMLKSGPVWPARAQDADAAAQYAGPIPMGTMFAIPPSVDLSSLGLTPEGVALGRALQDYGAHILVRASTVALFAEPLSDPAAVRRMRTDFQQRLFPLLRAVTNNTADNVAGGGARRQPAAASFTAPETPPVAAPPVAAPPAQAPPVTSVPSDPAQTVSGSTESTPTQVAPTPTGTVESYVAHVYGDLFRRTPDPAGLSSWSAALRQGTPYGDVANGITYSAEFRTALIRESYAHYLGREPDPAGLGDWLVRMNLGTHVEQIQAGFVASPEFYQRAWSDDRQWVANLYQDVLGRAPATSEIDSWQQQLSQGLNRGDIASGFLLSTEHLTSVVNGYYVQLLHRNIDPAGAYTWVTAIQAGSRDEEIIASIVSSAEYRNGV